MAAATSEMMESTAFKVDTNDEFEVYVKEEPAFNQVPSSHLPFSSGVDKVSDAGAGPTEDPLRVEVIEGYPCASPPASSSQCTSGMDPLRNEHCWVSDGLAVPTYDTTVLAPATSQQASIGPALSVDNDSMHLKRIRTALLIVEVQKRPAIWDPSAEGYKDKSKKTQAWVEICRALTEGYEEKSILEKANIGKDVQRKWKNIRDCYAKDYKKKCNGKRPDPVSLPARRYIFSELLSFLNNVIGSRSTASSSSSDDIPGEAAEEGPQDISSEQSVMCRQYSGKRKKISIEERMIQFMEDHEQQQKPDDDKDFLLSLLPLMKPLNGDEKLHFRMQVMHLLLNLRAKKQNRPPFESHGYSQPFPAPGHESQPILAQRLTCSNIPANSYSHFNSLPSASHTTQDPLQAGQQTPTTSNTKTVYSPVPPSPASDISQRTDASVVSLYDLDEEF